MLKATDIDPTLVSINDDKIYVRIPGYVRAFEFRPCFSLNMADAVARHYNKNARIFATCNHELDETHIFATRVYSI